VCVPRGAVEKRRRRKSGAVRYIIYLPNNIIIIYYTGAVCSTHMRNNNTRVMERVESRKPEISRAGYKKKNKIK